MPEDINSWWDICQLGGAGVAVALGPMCWMFWKRIEADTQYIRTQDRNTLEVLNELTRVLDAASTSNVTNFGDLKAAIGDAVDTIRGHIDASLRDR